VTLRIALRLGRVSNLPTVWTNVAAAAVLAGVPSASLGVLALALACSLFYVGGMFLNDAFDREFDRRVRPERPIPSGAVTASTVFAGGFALLAAGLAVVAATARLALGSSGRGVAAGLGLAAAIVLYDLWHKENPAAPLLMGLCRVLVYVTTAATLTGGVALAVGGGALVLLAYLIGLTYVARQENLGEVRNLWPLACLVAPFVVHAGTAFAGGAPALLYVGCLAWVVFALSHLGWQRRVDVPRTVVSLIAGIALVDGLALAGAGHPHALLVGGLGFALTLAMQRWVPGT
jgi:4-hydroxybenzoate polyprenyltransferase